MAQNRTTRDQLERLFDIARRAVRYWWLVAIVGVIGAGLSVAIALKQKHVYESETTLLYSEKISQSVLQGREVVQSSRKLSERYKEMLLARSNLALIVEEFALFPDVVEDRGTVAAAELLRTRVSFRDKGDIFRISYRGDTREEAQKVTARLATLLKEQDNAVRREQAQQTKTFLDEEKRRAEIELRKRETELTSFLAQHPEFVEDGAVGGEVGASIRAAQTKKAAVPKGNTELQTLIRQRSRIQARLDNPDGPVIPLDRTASPAKESPALKEARRVLQEHERELAEKTARFTEKHPDVVSAKNAVADAKQRLRRLEAEENAALGPGPAPIRSKVDRDALQSELARIEREITRVRARSTNPSSEKSESSLADELVNLETEHTRMNRRVDEGRERLEQLETKAFTAEITASSEFAEAAQLVVIDEAFLPTQPAGQGRKLIAIAGTLVFGVLGLAFAITLALIDDRVYRRQDIDELGIAPVLVVIPRPKGKKARG